MKVICGKLHDNQPDCVARSSSANYEKRRLSIEGYKRNYPAVILGRYCQMGMFSRERPEIVLGGVEPEIVTDLRLYLGREDIVILIDIDGSNLLADMLCQSEALMDTDKRVVLIGAVHFPAKPGKHIYRTVTVREMRVLLDIYRSYESSDRLFLFSHSGNYGNTWNYVNNGLISEQEMLEAMFV